jgi:hypothetical protein
MDVKAIFLALREICHLAHKHEVQYWLDAPGSDTEKLTKILVLAREALAEFPEDWRNDG